MEFPGREKRAREREIKWRSGSAASVLLNVERQSGWTSGIHLWRGKRGGK